MLEARDAILDELKLHLLRAQQKMKAVADGKRRDVEYEVGDLVFLKLRPYRQRSLAKRRNEKLAPRYFGPFQVLQKIGAVAYKLQLPDSANIHPVFHVSQLKKAIGNQECAQPHLPKELSAELEMLVEPEEILGVRPAPGKGMEVLVRWRGLLAAEATWESFEDIRLQFPSFHLEDKVKFWAASVDKPPIRFTYSRRKHVEG